MSAIEVAARVLHEEAEAILSLIDQLDDSFEDAVRLIENSSGRVILTGMGKSGHIAKKINKAYLSSPTILPAGCHGLP